MTVERSGGGGRAVVAQLRMYKAKDGELDAFVQE